MTESLKDRATRYALQKGVIKALKDENDALGAELADEMREVHASTGADRVTCDVGGIKVGTVSVRTETGGTDLRIDDADAYRDWCARHGFIRTDDRGARDYFQQTGEVPDGCEPVEVPCGGFAGITCRPNHRAVRQMIGSGALGEDVRGLLAGAR